MKINKLYRVVQKKRNDNQNLEGIAPVIQNRRDINTKITIQNWNNWDTSLWIKIEKLNHEIIIDSGVIEELSEVIKNIKKEQESIKHFPLGDISLMNPKSKKKILSKLLI